MPLERAAEVLDESGLEHAAELLVAQPVTRAIELPSAISADRASRNIPAPRSAVPRPASRQVGRRNERSPSIRLLSYPENTAGSIMTTEFVGVPSTSTVRRDVAICPPGREHPGDGLCDLRARPEESTEDVCRNSAAWRPWKAPYMEIGFLEMIRKRAGWLCALFLGEMLTASAMRAFRVGSWKRPSFSPSSSPSS